MLLHVVEAALPVQRQQHFSARFQRGRHEMHGLGAPPCHPQHRHIPDETAIVRLRTRDISAAGPGPAPAPPGPARTCPPPSGKRMVSSSTTWNPCTGSPPPSGRSSAARHDTTLVVN